MSYATTLVYTDRFLELVKKEAVLDALRAGGVDNWEFYEESLTNAGIDGDGNNLENDDD